VHCIAIGGVFDREEKHRTQLLAERASLRMEDSFTLIDFRPDVRGLLAALDIFILPSIEPEPFGMVVLEAMEAGVPVIASRAGGPLEIIADGEDGLFFEPGDEHSLSDAIEKLLSDPAARVRLGEAGRKTLSDRFTSQRQVDGIQTVLDSVIHGSDRVSRPPHSDSSSSSKP
ncbi:MAG: glycosyltransferase family 4 protein, partial [Alloacidobacterium sp.]